MTVLKEIKKRLTSQHRQLLLEALAELSRYKLKESPKTRVRRDMRFESYHSRGSPKMLLTTTIRQKPKKQDIVKLKVITIQTNGRVKINPSNNQ